MSISFDRNQTQTEYERIIGVPSVEALNNYKQQFCNYQLSNNDVTKLSIALQLDAQDFLYNGLLSLFEGLDGMSKRRYSWATVKLYYSVFYYLRASLAVSGIAILRNKSMYRLKVRMGEKPFTTGNKKYNSSHSGTIAHYKDIFKGTDKLLTNSIDDKDVYEWMENIREIVNYRQSSFSEPECLECWTNFDEAISNDSIEKLLKLIINDDKFIYCFQEDYAVVAIPLMRMKETLYDFKRNQTCFLSDDRKNYIANICVFKELFESILDFKIT